MGILKDPKAQETPAPKRKSLQADFSNLGPLKPGGGVGFLNFRDQASNPRKNKKGDDDMDSDDDDTDNPILGKADDEEAKDDDRHLSPDDIRRQGELAEGVRKIKVCPTASFAILHCLLTMSTAQAPAFIRSAWGQRSQLYGQPGFRHATGSF
jgi:hypothetical protein